MQARTKDLVNESVWGKAAQRVRWTCSWGETFRGRKLISSANFSDSAPPAFQAPASAGMGRCPLILLFLLVCSFSRVEVLSPLPKSLHPLFFNTDAKNIKSWCHFDIVKWMTISVMTLLSVSSPLVYYALFSECIVLFILLGSPILNNFLPRIFLGDFKIAMFLCNSYWSQDRFWTT